MPEEEKSDSVDRVRQALYRRDATSQVHARRKLHEEHEPEVQHAWDEEESKQLAEEIEKDPEKLISALQEGRVKGKDGKLTSAPLSEFSMTPEQAAAVEHKRLAERFVRTLFVASALFFVVAAGYAAYFFTMGSNQISCANIQILQSGPLSVASGKELVMNITVNNRNPVEIRDAELTVDFPSGARGVGGAPLPPVRKVIGNIASGQGVRTVERAVLFGRENDELEIMTSVSFSVRDSNARFECNQPRRIVISTAPVTVAVDGLQEISAEQELELRVTVTSNSEEVVPNMRLTVDYPFGYRALATDPEPSAGDSVWDIGDVSPGTERVIIIRGILSAIGDGQRNLRFSIGERDPMDAGRIATILQTVEHPVLITRPFLALSVEINGDDASEVSARLGELVQGKLTWRNDTEHVLHNVEIEAKLPGVLVDPRSVRIPQGFYRSVDNTILWTSQTHPVLESVEPGQSGTLQFDFRTYPVVESISGGSPAFDLAFDVRARRISDNRSVPQNLTGQALRTVRFISDVRFVASSGYTVGPFTNVGAHPPLVNQETTYTITWSLENTTNPVHDGTVVGELPVYITWLEMTAPQNESITFNPTTRRVTWNVGELEANTGVVTPPRQAHFQVSITPSISQLSRSPDLVQSIRFRGVDRFTADVLEQTHTNVTTKLENDPYFPRDFGRVAQ